ncbi:MAG: 4-hydroxy-tetrahydrodipicolinate reductase [Pseudomonadota bacterium]
MADSKPGAKTKLGVVGCGGRMGRMILTAIRDNPDCEIAGGTEAPESRLVGQDIGTLIGAGNLGLTVGADPAALFAASDGVLDFTAPAATLAHARLAGETGTALVAGTTGLTPEQQAVIEGAAATAPVVQAANMSLGVNLLLQIVEQVARSLDPSYDIEVLEMHHRHKVDAPSGTALALGEAAAAGRRISLEQAARKVRDGITGPREEGTIGFATLRGGEVPGEHTVLFAGAGERLELTHKAARREVFAEGAVKAALWAAAQPPGLYDMKDVLGLS